ncbi:MAG: hypothetical protein ABW321_26875 [Polyangiales bacterium]
MLSRTISDTAAPKSDPLATYGAMRDAIVKYTSLCLPLGLLVVLASCSDSSSPGSTRPTGMQLGSAGKGPTAAVGGSAPPSAPAAGNGNGNADPAQPGTAGAGSSPNGGLITPGPVHDDCGVTGTLKREGCPCRVGETSACWSGSLADRNVGACHDGLQVCTGAADSEFASWGPCMGEELTCGTDAGVPPPPEDEAECACIPGAIVQCSEDCSVGIICSLTASKVCQPDHTWSVCREDLSVTLDLPGFQCRNMLHGCFDPLSEKPGSGEGELYVGDCSKQFKCGHAPPPVTTPPPPPDEAMPN